MDRGTWRAIYSPWGHKKSDTTVHARTCVYVCVCVCVYKQLEDFRTQVLVKLFGPNYLIKESGTYFFRFRGTVKSLLSCEPMQGWEPLVNGCSGL